MHKNDGSHKKSILKEKCLLVLMVHVVFFANLQFFYLYSRKHYFMNQPRILNEST